MMSEQERTEIFRRCLEAIERGTATIDHCVAEYPDFPALQRMLELAEATREIPAPSMSMNSKAVLRSQLQHQMNTRKSQRNKPLATWNRWAVAAAALLIFLFSGLGVARSSYAAIPGDFLYGVKLGTEQLELFFATADTRPALLAKAAQMRLSEIDTLIQWGHPIDKSVFNDAMLSLNVALAAEIDTSVRDALYVQVNVLAQRLMIQKLHPDYATVLNSKLSIMATSTPMPDPAKTLVTNTPVPSMTATNSPTPTNTLTATVTLALQTATSKVSTSVPTIRSAATKQPTIRSTKVVLPDSVFPSKTPFITFTPMMTATPPSNELRTKLLDCVKDEEVQHSLVVKLNSSQLRAFINEVAAQSGKKIDPSCATQLIQLTTALLSDPTLTPSAGGVPNIPGSQATHNSQQPTHCVPDKAKGKANGDCP